MFVQGRPPAASGPCPAGSSGSRRDRWARASGATRRTSSGADLGPAFPAGQGGRSPADGQVGAQPLRAHRRAQRRHRLHQPVRQRRRPRPRTAGRASSASSAADRRGHRRRGRRRTPAGGARPRPAPPGRHRRGISTASPKRSSSWGRRSPSSGFMEPMSRKRLGWTWEIPSRSTRLIAAGRHVEQHVHQVVGQQVDLVDVQHPPVGGGQQPGREPQLPAGEGGGQVEGPDHPVLGRPDRQLDEGRRPGQQRRQAPGQGGLGAAFLAPQQHAPDAAVDARRGAAPAWPPPGPPRPRTAAGADRSTGTASSARHLRLPPILRLRAGRPAGSPGPAAEASHRPRSTASSSRSAMDRRAHGLEASRNLRTSGSAT